MIVLFFRYYTIIYSPCYLPNDYKSQQIKQEEKEALLVFTSLWSDIARNIIQHNTDTIEITSCRNQVRMSLKYKLIRRVCIMFLTTTYVQIQCDI